MKIGGKNTAALEPVRLVELLGKDLVSLLGRIKKQFRSRVYLTGGTVRDILLDRQPVDIDLTVGKGARRWAAELSRIADGTYVPLGRDEDAARVALQGRDIDFSSFREGAETIEEELFKRDITVNSMAVCIDCLLRQNRHAEVSHTAEIIDPAGGLGDLDRKLVRVTSAEAFHRDPLRLLRVYRFAATLGFAVDDDTEQLVGRQKNLIVRVATERVAHELDLIMASARAHAMIVQLAANGLLFEILPELRAGVGMEQPASHHLDVFEHGLATLYWMQRVQEEPVRFFPAQAKVMEKYLVRPKNRLRLRWAALLHDLGKPATVTIDEDRGGRITFYNHDHEGARQVEGIALRLHWSSEDKKVVAGLVAQHMRPFHLGNVQRQGDLSLKACLRLIRHVGSMLPGLFLLGMADALAGQGEGRPEDIEREIDALFNRIEEVRREHVEPVRGHPPLINGRDLIEELQLVPGPLFREVLERVEEAHMEKIISTRREALELARAYSGCSRDRDGAKG